MPSDMEDQQPRTARRFAWFGVRSLNRQDLLCLVIYICLGVHIWILVGFVR